MTLIKRFLVPVVFLAVFFVTISALQAHKLLLENSHRDVLAQAVTLIEQGSSDDIAKHIDSHYWDAENNQANRQVIESYKQQLANFGALKKHHRAVFSVRSERIPEHDDASADIYIVHADYAKGEMIYTLGLVNEHGAMDAKDNSSVSQWQLDRLSITSLNYAPGENQSEKIEYKLSLLCSEEKGISKKCRKK